MYMGQPHNVHTDGGSTIHGPPVPMTMRFMGTERGIEVYIMKSHRDGFRTVGSRRPMCWCKCLPPPSFFLRSAE